MLPDRHREVLRHLWAEGRLSRSELHRRTGMTPNGVGVIAEAMLDDGLLRECSPEPSGGGRPRVPLEIDPGVRHVVGLSIAPGRVEAARLGLRGQVLGTAASRAVAKPDQLVPAAVGLLKKMLNGQSLAIGASVTGFVDPEGREILFSSATPGLGAVSLKPLYQRAGAAPIVLGNDMHALAARWQLTHRAQEGRDVLLIGLDDGSLGAAILIDGRPNRGCVTGGNELGHNRFPIDTARCYCGHSGCLERIFSSDFLIRNGAARGTQLAERVARLNDGRDEPLEKAMNHLAAGLANAVNFVRPNRLVLVSRLVRYPRFTNLLIRLTRSLLLTEIADRVGIDLWDQPAINTGETAAWLALASLFYEGWTRTNGAASQLQKA
jgi:predicted NBD/HSP70 family sugar kinase